MAGDNKSVSVKLGWSLKGGFSAKFDSRTVEALDALGGDLIWQLNNERARINAREKALREAEAEIIAAAAKSASAHLKKEPKLALGLLKGGVSDFVERQINQLTVAEYTIEAIAAHPPSAEQAEAGSDRLDPDLLSRLRRYAGEASTEEVRRRLASVLAQELRVPGTFNGKVLRVIDETDRETAEDFLNLCKDHAFQNCLPVAVTKMVPGVRVHYSAPGLILPQPELQHFVKKFDARTPDRGDRLRLIESQGQYTLGIEAEGVKFRANASSGHPYKGDDGEFAFMVDYFTDVGEAICSTVVRDELSMMRNLARVLTGGFEDGGVGVYERKGDRWELLITWTNW